jgi:pimeloyl-ACP methyl ester carboxylesterase
MLESNMTTPFVDLLFIQGAGAGAHEADRGLADALGLALGADFRVHFPRMPDEGAPDNDVWKQAISTALRRTRATFLVAHSAGGAIAADLLAQGGDGAAELASLRAIVLLAPPFVGAGGWRLEGFHLDEPVAADASVLPPLHLYFGLADATVPPSHAELYGRLFTAAVIHRLPGCGHQFEGWMAHVARDVRALARA